MIFQKDINVRIPIGIKEDIRISLLQNRPSFDYELDNFIFILSKVISIPSRDSRYGTRKVPIYSKIIKDEIGNNYKKYLEWLIINDFLITDNWYCKKRNKSKCYGYSKKYYKRDLEIFKITKKSLVKRHVNWHFKRNSENAKELRENLKLLTFDFDSAMLELDMQRSKGKINKKDYELLKFKYYEIKEARIVGRRDKYGRFHSNFTQINKDSRKFIGVNGQRMVEIDVQSCQIGLLYSLIYRLVKEAREFKNDEFKRYENNIVKGMVGDFRDKYISRYGDNFYEGGVIPAIEVVDNLYELAHDNEFLFSMVEKELEKFKGILKKDFYKWIAKESKKYTNYHITRNKTKKVVFRGIFGRVSNDGYFMKILQNEFPTMLKIINYLKRNNYKELARTLQRDESTLIIDQLCGWLIKEKGIKEFYTVHDCVGVSEKHKTVVMEKLYELMNLNNIPTGLKSEYI